jgi:cell division transport system permease protein
MSATGSRWGALKAALRATLGRPLAFALVVGSMGMVLATLALLALTLWRAWPLEAPRWMRAEALVLVAGGEGEVDLAAVGSALRQVPRVLSAEFVGRDAALAGLAQRKGLAAAGLADLRPNPLPDAFLVRFGPDESPEAVEAAVAQLAKVRNVDSVEYQPETYRRAAALAQLGARVARVLTALLAALLILGVAVTVGFATRLDRAEARVLTLLGADPAAICRPYVYAGGIGVLAAAALAGWITRLAAAWLEPAWADLAQKYSLHWAPDPLPAWAGAALCAGAALLGTLVSAVAARIALRKAIREH